MSTRPTILIVDDEQVLLELFREALSVDYEVLIAKSVGDAIDLLQAQPVHAVLTDLNCGHDNGLDLLRWIEAHRPGLLAATFILSGAHDPDTEGFEVPVIAKPVDLSRLMATFAAIFESPRAHVG